MFRFGNPNMLWGFWGVLVLIIFFLIVERSRRTLLSRFGELELLKRLLDTLSMRARRWKQALLVLAYIFLVFAAARPQIGTKLEEVPRKGIDLVICLDLSNSMYAEDIKPNRFAKAKYEIQSFINGLKGDRVAIVVFAGDAFLLCPLTGDYSAASMLLDSASPDMFPEQGTNIPRALEVARNAFVDKERKHKAILLVTDGESHEGDLEDQIKKLVEDGIKVYTVGIGSPAGVPIPERNAYGNLIGYKKDKDGNVVTTVLDEATLQRISLETGGRYFRASAGQSELGAIFKEIEAIEKKVIKTESYTQFEERYQYFLGLAIAFLLVEFILPERRLKKK